VLEGVEKSFELMAAERKFIYFSMKKRSNRRECRNGSEVNFEFKMDLDW
jgi:hypothetical protein